jgi:hypothetical protein
VRAAFETECDAIIGKIPGLKDLAMVADNFWPTAIREHSGRESRHGLTGLYRVLFRHSSAVAHGTAYGLGGVIGDGPPGLLIIGAERPFMGNPFSLGGVVYAMGLLIYAKAFEIDKMAEALDAVFVAHHDPR